MDTNRRSVMRCANCVHPRRERRCINPAGKASEGCPTLLQNELLAESREEYRKEGVKESARLASVQEGERYKVREKKSYVMQAAKPRVLKICEFARKMGYRRLGLAQEAPIVAGLLEKHGFEVVSVACKASGVPKEEIGSGTMKKSIGANLNPCAIRSSRPRL